MKMRGFFKRNNGADYTLPGRFSRFWTFMEDTRVAGMACVDFLKRKQKAFGNVGIWLLFCVTVAFIPVVVRLVVDKATNTPFIWDNGELLAVSTGLLGDSVAVLWIRRTIARLVRGVLSIGAGVVFSGLVLFLTILATHPRSSNENFITFMSCLLFVVTVLVGVACKWMEG